jgi:hypothetical protein
MVMAASGCAVPPRTTAMRASGDGSLYLAEGAALDTAVSVSLASLRGIYRERSLEARSLLRLERQRIEIITNEEIPGGETSWLAERLVDRAPHAPLERALVAHMRREGLIAGPLLTASRERAGKQVPAQRGRGAPERGRRRGAAYHPHTG